jgi:uncharacterized membrane protein YedE/YeeE
MNLLRRLSWPPIVVGMGIGVLSWFSFGSADRALGITTAFEHAAALMIKATSPELAAGNSYFQAADKAPKIDWEWTLVLGVLLGSFFSAKLSGDTRTDVIPVLWKNRFGHRVAKRLAFAFVGGMVMMFGARVAQGCTSGHGISGALQFALSSWLFLPVMFASAILAAFVIYRPGGSHRA